MEDVRQLMEIIDDHVKSFPEGDYLKMCNNLRNIFRFIKGPPPEEEGDFDSESEVEFDLNMKEKKMTMNGYQTNWYTRLMLKDV